jgi:hypothetical protein
MKFNAKRAREAGKRSGAARKQASVIVEGLANAAARVDLSVEALAAARKAGCRAFRPGGRVNLPELEAWLLENGDIVGEGQSLNALRRRNLIAKIQGERIFHDELAAKYTPASDVAEASRRCSAASASVAKAMLPDAIRSLYVEKITTAFARLERDAERKTKHVAPPALEIAEPSDSSSLDDLRRVLLGWKTRVLEIENAVANGEMILHEKIVEMIQAALRQPVSMARKHLDTGDWNALCVATKEAFARALNPTPLTA